MNSKNAKVGSVLVPPHVFWYENKEAIDTKVARLCAEATETSDTRLNRGERSHFDFLAAGDQYNDGKTDKKVVGRATEHGQQVQQEGGGPRT